MTPQTTYCITFTSVIPPVIVPVLILLAFLLYRLLLLAGLPRAVFLTGFAFCKRHILESLLAGLSLAHIVDAWV